MRFMYVSYLLLIVAGIVYFSVIGLTRMMRHAVRDNALSFSSS